MVACAVHVVSEGDKLLWHGREVSHLLKYSCVIEASINTERSRSQAGLRHKVLTKADVCLSFVFVTTFIQQQNLYERQRKRMAQCNDYITHVPGNPTKATINTGLHSSTYICKHVNTRYKELRGKLREQLLPQGLGFVMYGLIPWYHE